MESEYDDGEGWMNDYLRYEDFRKKIGELFQEYGFNCEYPECLDHWSTFKKDSNESDDELSSSFDSIVEEDLEIKIHELAKTIQFIRLSKNRPNSFLKITSSIVGFSKVTTKSIIESIENQLGEMLNEYRSLYYDESQWSLPLKERYLKKPFTDEEIEKIIKIHQKAEEQKRRTPKFFYKGMMAKHLIKDLYDEGVFKNINGEGENISNELALVYDILVYLDILIDTGDMNKNDKYKFVRYCIRSFKQELKNNPDKWHNSFYSDLE